MTLDEEIQNRVLAFLPEADHVEATRRVKIAAAAGYHSFGIWEGWSPDGEGNYLPDPPELNDLVGVNPQTGLLEFIGVDGPLGKTKFGTNIDEEI